MAATTTERPVGTDVPVRCSSTHRALVEALNVVSMAIPARSPIPELRGVLVEAEGDGVVLRAYNHETAVTVRMDARPGGSGRSLLTHGELKMVLEAVAAGDTRAAVAAMQVDLADDVLTTPDVAVPLAALPTAKYPAFPPAAKSTVVVDGREWFGQLARVLPAAAPYDTPPGLATVRFEVKADGVHMAASDRYRLAVATVPAQPQDAGAARKRAATALVPARVLTQIARRLEKHDGPVSVGVHTVRGQKTPLVTFVIGSVEIVVHGAGGTFPKPDTLMPTGKSLAVEVDRTAMVRAAKKASALAKAKALGVHVVAVAVQDGRLTLAPRLETAEARARVRGIGVEARTVSGRDRLEGVPLTVNGGFLLDALDAFSGDTVTLHLRSLHEPILLTDGHAPAGTGYRHLMMPLATR